MLKSGFFQESGVELRHQLQRDRVVENGEMKYGCGKAELLKNGKICAQKNVCSGSYEESNRLNRI